MSSQVQKLDQRHTTDSFRQFHVEQIAADIKESICRVSDTLFNAEANANIPTVDYEVSFKIARLGLLVFLATGG